MVSRSEACLCALVLTLVALVLSVRTSRSLRMHRIAIDSKNECLVLEANVAGKDMFFQIDTGYAGPPVLSTTYLASLSLGTTSHRRGSDVASRYRDALVRVRRKYSTTERDDAVHELLHRSRCDAYTSGCTMRLMGIASIVEQQADMLLCPMIRFKNVRGTMVAPRRWSRRASADVLVTNPLDASCHILTCDYLFQVSPCFLDMGRGRMEVCVNALRLSQLTLGNERIPIRLAGGAVVVPIRVNGTEFTCTLDTGAPGPLCLSSHAARRLSSVAGAGTTVDQRGVNGETVTSRVTAADVSFAGMTFQNVAIFLNDTASDHSDGYVGMAFLRAVNIVLTYDYVAFGASGHPPLSADAYR